VFGDAEIVLWVEDVEPEFAAQALHLGINAFLPRNSALELYAECFRAVLAGGIWTPAELKTKLLSVNEATLTPRQRQLAMLLVQGLKNKEIAWRMGITEGTVKVYLSHLFQKVGASDRFEFALLALRNMTPNQAADLWKVDADSASNVTPFSLSRFCRPRGLRDSRHC
jgi:DNA-binding NarL/FixJ family response regulator